MIYQNVSRLCKQRGISISRLEKELGFGNATIQGWNGKWEPKARSLSAVAAYFGVSMESLMQDAPDDDKSVAQEESNKTDSKEAVRRDA